MAHLNKQWQKWIRMSTRAKTHTHTNTKKQTDGTEQQTVATVSKRSKGRNGRGENWGLGLRGEVGSTAGDLLLGKNRSDPNWRERLFTFNSFSTLTTFSLLPPSDSSCVLETDKSLVAQSV